MRLSNTHFDPEQLYWQDYLPLLRQFEKQEFPSCEQLNSLLPAGLTSRGGQVIRFVPSSELDGVAYERRIYTTGQVSTRVDNWHDLFNALVWIRFPRIKTAMNALHHQSWSQGEAGRRGTLRDALTLFDECGVIVFSSDTGFLNALATRQWSTAFRTLGPLWGKTAQLAITGHAMLEKYLAPYKSMTAKALLIHTDLLQDVVNRQTLLQSLDREIAEEFIAGNMLTRPASLSPLPLAGIPGWWPHGLQDDQFYSDPQVFRPAAENLVPAPINRLF